MGESKHKTWPKARSYRPAAPVALRVVETGAEVPLPERGQTLRIGSDPTAAIALDDRYVSRDHCELAFTSGVLVLRDRESRNGTYVNGARVREASLEVGTRVRIGGVTLEVLGDHKEARLAGEDPAFSDAVDKARRGARSGATVLLFGESGTGKELFAHLVHEASPRAHGPFVAVNCGAISRDLVESELFGHERGAFTGAVVLRQGVFEQASGGTLFLDEIAELPHDQQVRLLRVLETRRVRRVGGTGEVGVDVRVVAATHKNLRSDGSFRVDLYHRLAAIELRLPSLRERVSDIPLLARRFLAEAAEEHGHGGPTPVIDEALLARLLAHPWPGNVRELKNAMQRYAVMGEDSLAELLVLPPTVPPPAVALVTADFALKETMRLALERHRSVRKAAAAINMARSTFHDAARRFGLLARR